MNKIVPFVMLPSVLGLTWIAAARVIPFKKPVERRLSRKFELGAIHRIYLKIPAGAATVLADSASGVQVEEVRWLNGSPTDASQHWLETAKLNVTPAGDRLQIVDGPPLAKNAAKGGFAVTLHVPAGTDVDLNVDTGALQTRGSFHSMIAEVGDGSVVDHVENCPPGPSRIEVAAGTARVEMPIDGCATINATVGMGQIVGLPKAETPSSITKAGDQRTAVLGSGESKFNVRVGTGEAVFTANAPFQLTSQTYEDQKETGQAAERFQSTDDQRQESHLTNQDMDRIGKDVAKAMAQAQPEIDRALKQIQPKIERELAKIGPEIKRALRAAKPEIEKARREHRQAFDREMARAKPEIKRALAEAMKAMEEANTELDRKDVKEMDPHGKLKDLVQAAMQAAQEALKNALSDMTKDRN